MATHNCPDKNCNYTTQVSARMTEHIKKTRHGRPVREFRGYKQNAGKKK